MNKKSLLIISIVIALGGSLAVFFWQAQDPIRNTPDGEKDQASRLDVDAGAPSPLPNSIFAGQGESASISPEEIDRAVAQLKAHPDLAEFWKNENNELRFSRFSVTFGAKNAVFRHFYSNIEVMGSGVTLHEGENGARLSNNLKIFSIETTPEIPADQLLALHNYPGVSGADQLVEAPALRILPPDKPGGPTRLVYVFETKRETPMGEFFRYTVNADTGALIAHTSSRRSTPLRQVSDGDR